MATIYDQVNAQDKGYTHYDEQTDPSFFVPLFKKLRTQPDRNSDHPQVGQVSAWKKEGGSTQ